MAIQPPTTNHHPPASASSADDRRNAHTLAPNRFWLRASLARLRRRATSAHRAGSTQMVGEERNIMFGGMVPVV